MPPFATAQRGRFLMSLLLIPTLAFADDPRQADSPMLKLLKSGRVPAERQGTILEMIGKRGQPADLAYLYERALSQDGFSSELRHKALDALVDAALTRKVRPAGDLAGLARLIGDAKADASIRLAAVRLAGLWKVEAAEETLGVIAQAPETSEPLRAAALDALADLGGASGRLRIAALAADDRPWNVRARAVAALVKLDIEDAARRVGIVLRDLTGDHDPSPLLEAFLHRQSGAARLAEEIGKTQLPADAAKRTLRALYALGGADPALVSVLSQQAGLNAEVKPLDKPELDQLIAAVARRGNPERGEALFRRAELSCMKCHALAGAGGGVGPDLSALGSSSPIDYIINSIMLPDQAVKEPYQALLVLTNDGQVYHGIVVDKDNNRLVLKEATGELRVIPVAAIEDQKDGGSLMPKGLVNLLTRDEFIDLVRFLSELGKPGPYAIRATPTLQRWRVLKALPESLAPSVPDAEALRPPIRNADPDTWLPVYAKVSGDLPLDEVAELVKGPVAYLQGEIEVTVGGEVEVRLRAPAKTHAWIDERPIAVPGPALIRLEPGRHQLTLRVAAAGQGQALRVEVAKPVGSSAEYTVVGGR
jgi:putative heme-binding domain-containing protein